MFGPYAAFIIPSYLITGAIFLLLIAWAVLVHRQCRNELQRLEQQGVRRRSQARAGNPK